MFQHSQNDVSPGVPDKRLRKEETERAKVIQSPTQGICEMRRQSEFPHPKTKAQTLTTDYVK